MGDRLCANANLILMETHCVLRDAVSFRFISPGCNRYFSERETKCPDRKVTSFFTNLLILLAATGALGGDLLMQISLLRLDKLQFTRTRFTFHRCALHCCVLCVPSYYGGSVDSFQWSNDGNWIVNVCFQSKLNGTVTLVSLVGPSRARWLMGNFRDFICHQTLPAGWCIQSAGGWDLISVWIVGVDLELSVS